MLKNIDIFCDIIDNFGDIGFVYRLAREIQRSDTTLEVRVFLNDMETFSKINKKINSRKKIQIIGGVTYYNMEMMSDSDYLKSGSSQVAVEAYGCDIPEVYLENTAGELQIVINIEYLTAEEWAKDYHLKSSYINIPHVKKYFYMPGFEKWSGGVIIPEYDLSMEKMAFFREIIRKYSENPGDLQEVTGLKNVLVGTVFSYEYNFDNFIETIEKLDRSVILLVFGEKSKDGLFIDKTVKNLENTHIIFMNYMEQDLYDRTVCYSDFNLVRGEESFARALVAGKPFLWHAYCQEEKEHYNKVAAFLDFIKKFFSEKEFERYSKIMYNYNSRVEDNYTLHHEDFRGFFQDLKGLEIIFKNTSTYIKQNDNLVEKLLEFLNSQII